MKTVTIRVDEELFQQIEAKRGDMSKSDFYRNILVEYLSDKPVEEPDKHEYALEVKKESETLRNDLSHKEEMLRLMNERTKDLQNQLGFLQFEYQRLSSQMVKLLPAPRKWWEFWKK